MQSVPAHLKWIGITLLTDGATNFGEKMLDWMRAWILHEAILIMERKHIRLMKKKR